MPWARATAGIRCSTRDGQVAGDVLVVSECRLRLRLRRSAVFFRAAVFWPRCRSALHHLPLLLPPQPPASAGQVITGQVDGYLKSLEHLRSYGCLPRPPTRTTASGQTVVDVFPQASRGGEVPGWQEGVGRGPWARKRGRPGLLALRRRPSPLLLQGWRESKLSLLGSSGASVSLYLQPGKPETQVRGDAGGVRCPGLAQSPPAALQLQPVSQLKSAHVLVCTGLLPVPGALLPGAARRQAGRGARRRWASGQGGGARSTFCLCCAAILRPTTSNA